MKVKSKQQLCSKIAVLGCSGSVLDLNPTKAFQPAGLKIAFCFPHLLVCASALIMCTIIMSRTFAM